MQISGISTKSISLASCLTIHVSQETLQNIFETSGSIAESIPPNNYSIHQYGSSVRSTWSLYSRSLHRIHVFRSWSQHPLNLPRISCKIPIYVAASLFFRSTAISMSPDVCLNILKISGSSARSRFMSQYLFSQGPRQNPYFGFMSLHLRISGSSAKSMCPIHVSAFM